MRVIGRDRISEFAQKYPDSYSSLSTWCQMMERNSFEHFHHLKRTFGSADSVKPYTIFNIGGNKYRLITLVDYQLSAVKVEYGLTHSEYDREKWKK